jgi:hypothetical protein
VNNRGFVAPVAAAVLVCALFVACSSSGTGTPADSPSASVRQLTGPEAEEAAIGRLNAHLDGASAWMLANWRPFCTARERAADGWIVQCGMAFAAHQACRPGGNCPVIPEDRIDQLITYTIADDGSLVRQSTSFMAAPPK